MLDTHILFDDLMPRAQIHFLVLDTSKGLALYGDLASLLILLHVQCKCQKFLGKGLATVLVFVLFTLRCAFIDQAVHNMHIS